MPLTPQLKTPARNIAPGSRESSRNRMRSQKQKKWQTYQWPFKGIFLRHNPPFKPEGGAILPAARHAPGLPVMELKADTENEPINPKKAEKDLS